MTLAAIPQAAAATAVRGAIPPDSSAYAGRHVSELSVADLAAVADHAWDRAARVALSQGHVVTVVRDGRLVDLSPDGSEAEHGPEPRQPGR